MLLWGQPEISVFAPMSGRVLKLTPPVLLTCTHGALHGTWDWNLTLPPSILPPALVAMPLSDP